MDFPLRTFDVVGARRDEDGRRHQVGVKLGSLEWRLLNETAQEYGFTRTGMARRLICLGLRSLEKA